MNGLDSALGKTYIYEVKLVLILSTKISFVPSEKMPRNCKWKTIKQNLGLETLWANIVCSLQFFPFNVAKLELLEEFLFVVHMIHLVLFFYTFIFIMHLIIDSNQRFLIIKLILSLLLDIIYNELYFVISRQIVEKDTTQKIW